MVKMNREIKFRAWISSKKEMKEVLRLNLDNDNPSVHVPGSVKLGAVCWPLPYIKLMQYTNLKDKNGKEIYEGDIVKYETYYYGNHKTHKEEVKWHDDLEHDGFGEPLAMGYIFRGTNIEVIGNVFENPELLKETK